MPKILVVLGQTATGKSDIAVMLSREHNGEVVSADSRQIYKGLDIGTGKITQEEMSGVPHHMLSFLDPKEDFSVAGYKSLAEKAIDNIIARGKIPIVVGGTGFYIQAIVDNIVPPEVPPNKKLRMELVDKTEAELFEQIKHADPQRAETIEPQNKRRLVRALEIIKHIGKVPESQKPNPKYKTLQIGLRLPEIELKKRIRMRVEKRLNDGWIDEVIKLQEEKIDAERFSKFGLGYKIISNLLKTDSHKNKLKKIKKGKKIYSNILKNIGIDFARKEKLVFDIYTAEWQYAKRQKTWFKRDDRIAWSNPSDVENIKKNVREFLKQ